MSDGAHSRRTASLGRTDGMNEYLFSWYLGKDYNTFPYTDWINIFSYIFMKINIAYLYSA